MKQKRIFEALNMKQSKGENLDIGFDGSVRIEFHGARVRANGGLLACRGLDDALVLT